MELSNEFFQDLEVDIELSSLAKKYQLDEIHIDKTTQEAIEVLSPWDFLSNRGIIRDYFEEAFKKTASSKGLNLD